MGPHWGGSYARSEPSSAGPRRAARGIAWVGLVTVRASTGRVADTLDGYRYLIDYWERTGGWVQEWTTLRNLARLLRSLGDDETAVFLAVAANSAPDAPAVTGDAESGQPTFSPDQLAKIEAQVSTSSRARILDVARQAIDHHRAGEPSARGSVPAK